MSTDNSIRLGVNLDHLVAIRQARRTPYPDLSEAITLAEQSGADGITLHLREDRRHVQTSDVYMAREIITSTLNLEMAATSEMVQLACDLKPDFCCVVPERREELTTEGGLDVIAYKDHLYDVCNRLAGNNIKVSLFIEPEVEVIDAVCDIGVPIIELHTGQYAITEGEFQQRELERIVAATDYASSRGLQVNAGHGLEYQNVKQIAAVKTIKELNIGHAIIARALFVGLVDAIGSMKSAMIQGRQGLS